MVGANRWGPIIHISKNPTRITLSKRPTVMSVFTVKLTSSGILLQLIYIYVYIVYKFREGINNTDWTIAPCGKFHHWNKCDVLYQEERGKPRWWFDKLKKKKKKVTMKTTQFHKPIALQCMQRDNLINMNLEYAVMISLIDSLIIRGSEVYDINHLERSFRSIIMK